MCCLRAVLRDWARRGLLVAHDGNWRGRQLISAAWVLDAATVRLGQPHVWPGTATETRQRENVHARGAQGQRIYVDPRSKLVMVNTAVQQGF